MLGHRAIYHDGWRAVCPWPGPSFAEAGMGFGQPISAETLSELDATGWELYHVAEDFAENHNVAADNRDRLIALIGTWYVEAGKYGVMPIDGSGLARMVAEKPLVAAPRDSYTLPARTPSRSRSSPAPRVLNRPHSITATVEIPEGGAEGVLLCQGTAAGGYSLLHQGRQAALRPQLRRPQPATASTPTTPSRPGTHELRFEFEPTGAAGHAARARARPGGCSSTSTAPSSADAEAPGDHAVRRSTRARSPAAPTPAPR